MNLLQNMFALFYQMNCDFNALMQSQQNQMYAWRMPKLTPIEIDVFQTYLDDS